MNPDVQVNVNSCGGQIDLTATWQVQAQYDDAGLNVFAFGPCDLATARAVLVAMAARTNVRQATIVPVGG